MARFKYTENGWINKDTNESVTDKAKIARLNARASGTLNTPLKPQPQQETGLLDTLSYILGGTPQTEIPLSTGGRVAPKGSTGVFSFGGEAPQTIEEFITQQANPNRSGLAKSIDQLQNKISGITGGDNLETAQGIIPTARRASDVTGAGIGDLLSFLNPVSAIGKLGSKLGGAVGGMFNGDQIKVQTSDGQIQEIDADKLEIAKQRDPGLQVIG